MDLCEEIYEVTRAFPDEEKFGLTSQMRRSSISVPSNIAGAGRNSKKEFKQFLAISQGSIFELETQLDLSRRLDLLKTDRFNTIHTKLVSVSKMIRALSESIRSQIQAT